MSSEPNFIDVVALSRITPQVYVENFGSTINSSFFDASNILGTLKMKKLIDFSSNFSGQNEIKITDSGNKLLQDLYAKAEEAFDQLDMKLVEQLESGKRSLGDITGAVNIAETDLAMHLYKLSKQGYVSYEIRNGAISISLTEKGFMRAKEGMPSVNLVQQPVADTSIQTKQQIAPQPQAPIQQDQLKQEKAQDMNKPENGESMVEELQKAHTKARIPTKRMGILVLLLIIIIILIVLLVRSL